MPPALLSEQVIKLAIKQGGMVSGSQGGIALILAGNKIWFPNPRGNIVPLVRRLNRNDVGHLIHFITGQNYLLRTVCSWEGLVGHVQAVWGRKGGCCPSLG